jgi:hypothetical protein
MTSTYGSIHSQKSEEKVEDGTATTFDTSKHSPTGPSTETSSPFLTRMLKIFAVTCLSILLLQSTSAWNMPKNIFQKATAVATISAAIMSAPLAVNAVDFSGSYADPFHPNCLREVQVVSPSLADVTGTDGTPGCPPDGSGRKWSLTGKIVDDSILIDFTPKGGPKNLKGVWESSPVAGIRFPDGNLWSKKATVQ